MKRLCIHHHLGLGDHFVCNGLVHKVASAWDKIYLPTKRRNFKTISSLYADFENIEVFVVDEEYSDVANFCNNHQVPLLRVGFEHCAPVRANESFYHQLNINYEERYTGFRVPTQIAGASELYDRLVPSEPYVIVHQESSVGSFNLPLQTPHEIVEIKSGVTENLLEYVKIIENAAEIHCIDSSVFNLIEGMKMKTNQLFFYDVKDNLGPWAVSSKWTIIPHKQACDMESA